MTSDQCLFDKSTQELESSPLSTLESEIEQLYSDVHQAEQMATLAGRLAVHLYHSLGEKLLEAKSQIKHGQWLPWLKERNIPERKAQRAVEIARGWDVISKTEGMTELTLSYALSLLKAPKLSAVREDSEKQCGEFEDSAGAIAPANKPTVAIKSAVQATTVNVQAVDILPSATHTKCLEVFSAQRQALDWMLEHGYGERMARIAIKLLEWCNAEDLEVIAAWIEESKSKKEEARP